LRNGQEAIVPLDRLSEEDRKHIASLNATGQAIRLGSMPDETKIDTNIPIEGGPRTFVTPHFVFDSEKGVTKAFISEAARVFEGTLEAVRALPLGIEPKPAEGEARFRTLFLERSTFEEEFNKSVPKPEPSSNSPGGGVVFVPPPSTGTANVANVAGVYFPKRKEVLVPFTSLGVNMSGSKVSLRRRSDTTTLVHEITHQVMHDWLLIMPLWLGEGLAEYLSAVPYQNGRFEFKNAAAGLKETLVEQHGAGEGRPIVMLSPSRLVERSNENWQGTPEEYLSSMLLVYYFIHLDQPEKPCAALAGYL
ncbi:MAG: hypothetical protein KDM63_21755, partial [Verrucomicrobiae bacterium]|nr:hypothetical protein [Verrucomicrobiae bacterium]